MGREKKEANRMRREKKGGRQGRRGAWDETNIREWYETTPEQGRASLGRDN